MGTVDLTIQNAKMVIPRIGVVEGGLAVDDGKIVSLGRGSSLPAASKRIDAKGMFVIPAGIDPHVHLGYGGLESDFRTESKALALGGIGTLHTTHRNVEPKTVSEIRKVIELGQRTSSIDFSLRLGVLTEQQMSSIAPIHDGTGINVFKFYMAYKGEEGKAIGVASVNDGFILDSFSRISKVGGVACVHAENPEIIARRTEEAKRKRVKGLRGWHEGRPPEAEAQAIAQASSIARLTGCTLYVVHLTSALGLEQAMLAKSQGRVYLETCPHYLTHTVESSAGVQGKVNPPIRTKSDCAALWEGLRTGAIETIGSDHVPLTEREKFKEGDDIMSALPGIANGGLTLPVLLSEGFNKGRLTMTDVARVTSENVALAFGLYPQKGVLAIGSDADLVIVDTKLEKKVEVQSLDSRADFSVYEGWKLKGWPSKTLVRGRVVAEDGVAVHKDGGAKYVVQPKRGVAE